MVAIETLRPSLVVSAPFSSAVGTLSGYPDLSQLLGGSFLGLFVSLNYIQINNLKKNQSMNVPDKLSTVLTMLLPQFPKG